MSDYFFDASAVVKRYADEAGSTWVRQITDAATQNTIVVSEITLAEVTAALAAKQRAPNGLTLTQRDRVLSLFFQDCNGHFSLATVDRTVIDRAVDLALHHRLRAYDAVQLATALEANKIIEANGMPKLTFVAADNDLLNAAKAESLPTENPLHYAHLDT